jgi:hypothetical protein
MITLPDSSLKNESLCDVLTFGRAALTVVASNSAAAAFRNIIIMIFEGVFEKMAKLEGQFSL